MLYMDIVHISIKKSITKELTELKNYGDSYSDVTQRLLNFYYAHKDDFPEDKV